MGNYLTIDGGTTNTRIYLVLDGQVVDSVRFGIGSVGGKENTERLKAAIKEGISNLLSGHGKKEFEIERILASGMITSDGGLCSLPHLETPCGLSDLAQAIYECELPEISPIRFAFLRGVRTKHDMMRGEETELMGLCEEISKDTLYILPGSHTKLIKMDEQGRICKISTELTGEMLRALSEGTILRESVTLQKEFDEEFLLRGYRRAEERGLNAALFGVRILDRLDATTATQRYSFFLGAVYASEVKNILSSSAVRIVIGGKPALSQPLAYLLRANGATSVKEVSETEADGAMVKGAIKIYEFARRKYRGKAI